MSERNEILKPFVDNSAYINSHISEGIELYRKGNARLELVRKNGLPVSNARISLKLRQHKFLHGCNLFLLDEIDDAQKNQVCKERYSECFNQATLPFYWKNIEPEKGKLRFSADSPRVYRRPAPDLCLDWCNKNNIIPKAHCLNYYNEMPDWVPTDSSGFWKELERRFELLAKNYADKINGWEVTNETLSGFASKDFNYGNSPFYDKDYVERSFALAEKYFPNNELIINEAHYKVWVDQFRGYRSAYYMQIERALNQGARIDTIGFQFHMFSEKEKEMEISKNYYDPYMLYSVMERYSDFGKPLQITEVTVPAFSNDTEDEFIQAEIIKNLYKIWFSQGNVEAVTYWNLVDGYAYSEDNVPGNMTSGENRYYGGLLRFDGSPKPAYNAIKDLFHKEWHTELDSNSDDKGNIQFSGFYGEYEIEILDGNNKVIKTFSLNKENKEHIKIVID